MPSIAGWLRGGLLGKWQPGFKGPGRPTWPSALTARGLPDLRPLHCEHAGSGKPCLGPPTPPHPTGPTCLPPLPRCLYPQVMLPSTRPTWTLAPLGRDLCCVPHTSVALQLPPSSCCFLPFPILLLLRANAGKVLGERMDSTSMHDTGGACGPPGLGPTGADSN